VSVLEACGTSERLQRYGHVQLSSFGRLRRAGFALLATFESIPPSSTGPRRRGADGEGRFFVAAVGLAFQDELVGRRLQPVD
jgi:hypothetical protein